MIHFVYTIYDQKAEAYLPPFILPTGAMAKRTFADCVNDPKHAFGRHPYDYTLFQLGTFDDAKAFFLLEKAPRSMGNGIEFVEEDVESAQIPLQLVGEKDEKV